MKKKAIKVFNTLGRELQEFKTRHKIIGIYSCGPTVYWYQHIGNLRTYIFSDILKRVLLYNKHKVKHVMNVTDVGHLTSDADTGEDKMENAVKREHRTAQEIAEFYWKAFRADFRKLNIIEPDVWCKATEHIKEQISLIAELEKKGYTYKTGDSVYFDTSRLSDYGKLAGLSMQDLERLEAGKRIELGEKKNKTDFALWKFSEKPGLRQQEWDSKWGIGFPGWHIECSAMSMKYLSNCFQKGAFNPKKFDTIDIHTGGIDHIPVHHTNEIAQSEAAAGKRFVNYWMHGAFLTAKGEKISKSKGGLFTISELEDMGFKPLSFRYFCFTAHYRSPLNFDLESLQGAQNAYERLKNIISELKDDGKTNKKCLNEFEKAVCHDLDMPKAIAVLWNLVRDKEAEGKVKTIERMDKILGLGLFEKKKKEEIPKNILALMEKREGARKAKDWKTADKIREKIKQLGFVINDTPEGAKIDKA